MEGVSIVIPAWNEEDRLPSTLERYLPALESRGTPYEVIVVADGSIDRTAALARTFAGRGVRALEFPHRLGKGGAVLAGMHAATMDYVGYLDADGPIPPGQLARLMNGLDEVDCVIASRWMRQSEIVRPQPWANRFAGRIWNLLVRLVLFLPLSDTQCGAKFFRRSVVTPTLRAVSLTNRAFDVALLYHLKKSGGRLKEMPVAWQHDPASRMPIARAIPIMFLSLLGMRLMNSPISRRLPPRFVSRMSLWFLEQWGTA